MCIRDRDISDKFDTTVDIVTDAYIPAGYIANEFQKLDIYKRIAGIETEEEKDEMLEELIDRFGEPPKDVYKRQIRGLVKSVIMYCLTERRLSNRRI